MYYYCVVVGIPAFLHHSLTKGFPLVKVTFVDALIVFGAFWCSLFLVYFTGISFMVFLASIALFKVYNKILFFVYMGINLGCAVAFKLLLECLAGFPSSVSMRRLSLLTFLVWALWTVQKIEPESKARLEFEGVCFLTLMPYVVYISFNVDPSAYRSVTNLIATALNAHQVLRLIGMENVVSILGQYGPLLVEGPLLVGILIATSNRVIMAKSLGFGDRRRVVAVLHNLAAFALFCGLRFWEENIFAVGFSLLWLVCRYIVSKLVCLWALKLLGLDRFWRSQSVGMFDRSEGR